MIKAKEQESRRDGFEKRAREEGNRGKIPRSKKLEYQLNKVGGWPNGLAWSQTYDLG